MSSTIFFFIIIIYFLFSARLSISGQKLFHAISLLDDFVDLIWTTQVSEFGIEIENFIEYSIQPTVHKQWKKKTIVLIGRVVL